MYLNKQQNDSLDEVTSLQELCDQIVKSDTSYIGLDLSFLLNGFHLIKNYEMVFNTKQVVLTENTIRTIDELVSKNDLMARYVWLELNRFYRFSKVFIIPETNNFTVFNEFLLSNFLFPDKPNHRELAYFSFFENFISPEHHFTFVTGDKDIAEIASSLSIPKILFNSQ